MRLKGLVFGPGRMMTQEVRTAIRDEGRGRRGMRSW